MTKEVYSTSRDIYKALYTAEVYSDELQGVLEEGLYLVKRLDSSDIRLGFRLCKVLHERINVWGFQLEGNIQNGKNEKSSISQLEVLSSISIELGEVLDDWYLKNGGKNIQEGRELIQKYVTSEGRFMNEFDYEIALGINLMISGLEQFSEIDIYGAQLDGIALRFFIESCPINHASNVIKKAWESNVSKLNKLLTTSMNSFYPDLTS